MAISLEKGQRISLEKSGGGGLTKASFGINWGMIEKKGLFGKKMEAVDLDASAICYGADKEPVDVCWFRKLRCGNWMFHSGDDLTGDSDGDDGLDNEIITLDLTATPSTVEKIVFVLHSFRGHKLNSLPYAGIRIFEGQGSLDRPPPQSDIVATYRATDQSGVAMILGILYRKDGSWKYQAVGEALPDRTLEESVETVRQRYL